MKKHAYLIKAHHQFGLLEKLLILLDDERNDIYIHIGKNVIYDKRKLESCTVRSHIYFVPPVKETWGGYSQIKSELSLFKAAKKGDYVYYHLLSGADLPLKTQDQIHSFFKQNEGKEFLYFCPSDFWKESAYKYEQYRFLQEKIGRENRGILYQAERVSLFLQRKLGICRNYGNMCCCLGANWMSITHGLLKYILKNERLIYKMFHATLCCDEFFVQTLVWNSPFRKNVFSLKDDYFACLRLIDWKRGQPYVWRKEDFQELIDAPHLFARKFDETIDSDIVDMVFETIQKKQEKERKTHEK